MYIIITMAGASSRFINAGYPPKYTLEIKPGYTMFEWSLDTFEDFFAGDNTFIFVTNSVEATLFVRNILSKDRYSVMDYTIYTLDGVTRGQAETAYIALQEYLGLDTNKFEDNAALGKEVMIFNIDTYRKNLMRDYKEKMKSIGMKPTSYSLIDVVYDRDADEKKWSFCLCDPCTERVYETAEKKKIGPYYSTGLYHFSSAYMFLGIYNKIIDSHACFDYYIAPMYNHFIQLGAVVHKMDCSPDDIEIAGVPEDYERVKAKYFGDETQGEL